MIKRTEAEKKKSRRRVNILILVMDLFLVGYLVYVLIRNLV